MRVILRRKYPAAGSYTLNTARLSVGFETLTSTTVEDPVKDSNTMPDVELRLP
jgi:hypothetical protein